MPKRKSSARSTKRKTVKVSSRRTPPRARRLAKKISAPPSIKLSSPRNNYTQEYSAYLERYELFGEGRPHLSPAEFDRLDNEMLDLLALETEQGILSDEQLVRFQELEYLLLDEQ